MPVSKTFEGFEGNRENVKNLDENLVDGFTHLHDEGCVRKKCEMVVRQVFSHWLSGSMTGFGVEKE